MQRMWIELIVQLARRLIPPDMWASLERLTILVESRPEVSGAAKRRWVLNAVLTSAEARTVASWALNLALEALVARLRTRSA